MNRPRVRQLPWSARDLVLRHRGFFGTLGILEAGVAFGTLMDPGIPNPARAGMVLLGGICFLEGILLAHPRPVRVVRDSDMAAPPPPPGALRGP